MKPLTRYMLETLKDLAETDPAPRMIWGVYRDSLDSRGLTRCPHEEAGHGLRVLTPAGHEILKDYDKLMAEAKARYQREKEIGKISPTMRTALERMQRKPDEKHYLDFQPTVRALKFRGLIEKDEYGFGCYRLTEKGRAA